MRAWIARLIWVAWAVAVVIAAVRMLSYNYQVSPMLAYVVVGLSLLLFLVVGLPAIGTLFAPAPASLFAVVSGLSSVIALGAVALVAVGFRGHFIGRGTAAPPDSITDVSSRSQFKAVLAYATGLSYDASTHNAPDSMLLVDSAGSTVYVTRARIAPAVGANFVSYAALGGAGSGRGRVVARIRLDTTYGGRGYPKLNIPAGESYVWVDSVELHDTTGTFRGFVIPAGGDSVIRLPAAHSHYFRSLRAHSNFPMARWILYHSYCTNVPCSRGCCQSCPN
jgi:hypothetical protein